MDESAVRQKVVEVYGEDITTRDTCRGTNAVDPDDLLATASAEVEYYRKRRVRKLARRERRRKASAEKGANKQVGIASAPTAEKTQEELHNKELFFDRFLDAHLAHAEKLTEISKDPKHQVYPRALLMPNKRQYHNRVDSDIMLKYAVAIRHDIEEQIIDMMHLSKFQSYNNSSVSNSTTKGDSTGGGEGYGGGRVAELNVNGLSNYVNIFMSDDLTPVFLQSMESIEAHRNRVRLDT